MWAEKQITGDRFRFHMGSKNGNVFIGEMSSLNPQSIVLALQSFRCTVHMNMHTGFFLPLGPELRLSFSPNDARITVSEKCNATFGMFAAFVIASRLKRVL